jgi:hypothetical protein
MQYLKVKRVLPLVSKATAQIELDAYRDHITRDVGPRPVPNQVRKRVSQIAKTLNLDQPELSLGDILGRASCAERTRKQGGRSATLVVDGPVPGNLLEETTLNVIRDTPIEYKDSVLVAVRELGSKVRIVTKNEAVRVSKAHVVRRAFDKQLNSPKWSSTSEANLDPELSVIEFTDKPGLTRLVFSGDFTNATGEITHEYLDILCEELHIDPDLLHRRFSVDGRAVTSGTFQGMPAGWVVGLQIGHYAIASLVDPDHDFRIKGDDIISLWTDAQITLYRRLAASVGLIVNHKTVISDRFGTFCEADYRREGNRLIRLPTFSLRAYARDEPPSDEAIKTYLDRGVPWHTLRLLQKHSFKKLKVVATDRGIPLYVPKFLGGLGLIPEHPTSQLDESSCRLLQIAANGLLPVYLEEVSLYTSHVQQVNSYLRFANTKIDPGDDATDDFVKLSSRALAIAEFRSSLEGEAEKAILPTPSSIIRSRAAWRRRSLKVKSTFYPQSWLQALKVKDRIGVTRQSFNMVALRFAMANRVAPWYQPRNPTQ